MVLRGELRARASAGARNVSTTNAMAAHMSQSANTTRSGGRRVIELIQVVFGLIWGKEA